jgi:geranylgeranyl reductase family protein
MNSTVSTLFDALIIGCGPAGTTCAIRLKQLNPHLKIAIVDRQAFPRDKPCGDGLGPGVHKVIHDLGLLHIFNGCAAIEKLIVSSPDGSVLNSELPEMDKNLKPMGYVIPRQKFDNTLLEYARSLDVVFYEKYELVNFNDIADFETAVTIKSDTEEIKLKTKVLIGADGARSKMRRLLNVPFNSDKHTGISKRYYCTIEGTIEPALQLDFLKNINPGYGWLFTINENYGNIGVFIDVSKLKKRKLDLDTIFDTYLDFINTQTKVKIIAETKATYMLPYGSELPPLVHTKNKVLIGDAASMINPFTGEGIYYSMYAGFSLADTIFDKITDTDKLTLGLAAFEKQFKAKFKRHYKINNVGKWLMNSPFSNIAIKACQKDLNFLKKVIELMMGDRKKFNPLTIVKMCFKEIPAITGSIMRYVQNKSL